MFMRSRSITARVSSALSVVEIVTVLMGLTVRLADAHVKDYKHDTSFVFQLSGMMVD